MMPTRAPAPVPPRPAGQVNDLLPLGAWVRHHSLRSWPVLLFLLLICPGWDQPGQALVGALSIVSLP